MAKMAWGVEHVTENVLGDPWPGHEREAALEAARAEGAAAAAQQPGGTPLRYVIQTPVPEQWTPLVPVSLDPARGEVACERRDAQRRRRAHLAGRESAGYHAPHPRGRAPPHRRAHTTRAVPRTLDRRHDASVDLAPAPRGTRRGEKRPT